MTDRDDFEAVFSKPPFEFSMERYDEDGTWPGNYKQYHCQCAWEGWQEKARARPVVPDGFVLMPVEPMVEMLDIFPFNSSMMLSDPMDVDDLRDIYSELIARCSQQVAV